MVVPIYQYQCECGHKFDVFESRKILDDPKFKPACPKCKKKNNERVIAQTSFQLVGSGWAKTGYVK